MLYLWVNGCISKECVPDGYTVVSTPDIYFKRKFKDYDLIGTDYAFRVLKDCSRAVEMFPPFGFKDTFGSMVSLNDASTGAKVCLLIKSMPVVVDWEWCGDNCNRYIAEVANEKDVYMYSTRHVNPYECADNLKEVMVLNTGKICRDRFEYFMELLDKGLM